MDVYLVSAGPDRHLLYCEPSSGHAAPRDSGGPVVWRRLHDVFARVLAAVEREDDGARADVHPVPAAAGLLSRLRSRVLGWMARRVAEQRVLWRLQGQKRMRAFHPDCLDSRRALAAIHQVLRTESKRHTRLLGLDAFYLLLSLLLAPLPGPNLLGYYFGFRVVGHVLSIRGARQGLARVVWDLEPSHSLGELVGIACLPAAERDPLVRRVADELGLPRFPRFCERAFPVP
jgi:hypothetical protein